jgi:hypothetical protein
MQYERDGMMLWFGTPDAPAPDDIVPAGQRVSITIGIQPQDASHVVTVMYRLANRPDKPRTIPAQWIRSDPSGKSQHYKVEFPPFAAGDVVEYAPICRLGDRYVPFPPDRLERDQRFLASFSVTERAEDRSPQQEPPPSRPPIEPVPPQPVPSALLRGPYAGQVPDSPPQPPEGNPDDPWLRLFGAVWDRHGETADGVTVYAFDRDLRNEEQLGASPVREGRYEIRYKRSQFRRAEKDDADLLLKVLNADGKEIYRTPIRYNAPDDLEWNLTLRGAPYLGASEWDTLTERIRPLLENVAPQDLRENEQFQDVSFLAGETGLERIPIVTWIACFHLADKTMREKTPMAPEAFFAFMRQGQPALYYDSLLADMQYPDRIALLEDRILRELSAIIPDQQRALIKRAIDENIVPLRLSESVKTILDALQQIRIRYLSESTIGGGKSARAERSPVAAKSSMPDSEVLRSQESCLAAVSKDLDGEATVVEASRRACRTPACESLMLVQHLRLKLVTQPCDSQLALTLEGSLVIQDLTTLFSGRNSDARGVHVGHFYWTPSGGGRIVGTVEGVTNAGLLRLPTDPDAESCERVGVLAGYLSGLGKNVPSIPVPEFRLFGLYRISWDADGTLQHTSAMRGSFEGVLVQPCR